MLILVKDGNTEYKIVLPEDASPSQEWAAKQLNKYIKLSSEGALIVEKSYEHISKSILLGDNELV